ncbi:helix-turn-helix domain-containing protein [Streptomyces sp. NPDC007100]|uniref:helix-turn-helix domain-containing protein n=1 Tax=Streptomyces sp. NPDC007100 TaxID=3155602 RepID=UPI0033DEF14C
MTYRLVMTKEARTRLDGLRRADPPAARRVGEAVTALLDQGLCLGLPLVVPVGPALRAGEPREALDYWYQRQLTLLLRVRQAVVDVTISRKKLDRQISELGRQARRLAELGAQSAEAGRKDLAQEADDRRSAVKQQQVLLGASCADVRRREAALAGISRRVQDQVDAFRSRRAGVEAVQRAGHAQQDAHDAITATDAAAGEREALRADADGAVAAARAEAGELAAGAERLEHEVSGPVGVGPPAAELYELRLAALTGRDLRVLFAVEGGAGDGSGPRPQAVVLLAVAADRTQWWEWYEQALPLARERLADRERRGPGPGAEDEVFCADPAFLRGWYPGEDEERRGGAAVLVARNRGQRLAAVRRRRGLTQGQLARRMGVPATRVAEIERAEPGAVEVRALAAYVEAVGGRLEIVADFDTERLVLG